MFACIVWQALKTWFLPYIPSLKDKQNPHKQTYMDCKNLAIYYNVHMKSTTALFQFYFTNQCSHTVNAKPRFPSFPSSTYISTHSIFLLQWFEKFIHWLYTQLYTYNLLHFLFFKRWKFTYTFSKQAALCTYSKFYQFHNVTFRYNHTLVMSISRVPQMIQSFSYPWSREFNSW